MERRRRRTPSSVDAAVRAWPATPVTLLLIALVIPWVFSIGSMAVSMYRLVLLALTVPALFKWLW